MMTHKTTNTSSISQGSNQSDRSFYGLGIAPKILDILVHIKFKVPTPIQFKAIPLAIEGKDVIGIAQSGTGKTHSFATPEQSRDVRNIERLIRLTLPVSKHPEIPPEEFVKILRKILRRFTQR